MVILPISIITHALSIAIFSIQNAPETVWQTGMPSPAKEVHNAPSDLLFRGGALGQGMDAKEKGMRGKRKDGKG